MRHILTGSNMWAVLLTPKSHCRNSEEKVSRGFNPLGKSRKETFIMRWIQWLILDIIAKLMKQSYFPLHLTLSNGINPHWSHSYILTLIREWRESCDMYADWCSYVNSSQLYFIDYYTDSFYILKIVVWCNKWDIQILRGRSDNAIW